MDGKAYPRIRITIKDIYPKVLVARRIDDEKSLYFGPFPSTSSMRLVLRTIRRIFPFQSVANHSNRLCLYNHLGLCPCPEVVGDKEYKKNIYHIVTFLKGKTKKVISSLEKERDILSKREEFEKAEDLQRKINAINYVTSPAYENFDHRINPNLDDDVRSKELFELKTSLLKYNVRIKSLKKIECFDISNILGTNATGSMVVFINGEKDKSSYRRFRIKYVKTPNDFAMMKEVLQRRIVHSEWSYPDLIIVDGGKGQVSSAATALRDKKLNIPLIGLAKREEIIITSDFKEIKLPKNSEALKLIMRIRDEAHRFAISYHKKLRSKTFLPSAYFKRVGEEEKRSRRI